MEVGAASSSSYLLSQFAEPRQAKGLVRDIFGARESLARVGGERPEASPVSKPAEASEAKGLRNETENRSAAQAREMQSPQPAATSPAGGSIQMDVEDGDRVLKVFDSKDVLIYQLPPKGALMLIKSQEQEQQSQVQTSA